MKKNKKIKFENKKQRKRDTCILIENEIDTMSFKVIAAIFKFTFESYQWFIESKWRR